MSRDADGLPHRLVAVLQASFVPTKTIPKPSPFDQGFITLSFESLGYKGLAAFVLEMYRHLCRYGLILALFLGQFFAMPSTTKYFCEIKLNYI